MNPRRWKEVTAMLMIGDGVLGLVAPRRHVRLWRMGPRPLRRALGRMLERPRLTRGLGLAEAAAGLWLARRQYDRQAAS